jgi:hypothetical protein
MDREAKIKELKANIARRTARLDQLEEQAERQYDYMKPRANQMRFDDIKAWRFGIEIDRWELEGFINSESEDAESDD